MSNHLTAAIVTLCACTTALEPYDDPELDDGKGDAGSTATLEGALAWDTVQPVTFDHGPLAYLTFELSGSAALSLETDRADVDLDTVLYVYRPTGDKWGRYLARNDDGGPGKFSKLSLELPAGAYRVLVLRKGDAGAATITGSCKGDGCTPPPRGCTPLAPRTVAPELFIGPTHWQAGIDAAIDSATTSLDVQMYLFTVTEIADRIIAAHDRGVAVRVLLDPDEPDGVVHDRLAAAGIEVRLDPPAFSFAHAKYLVIDGATGVIQSGNFNAGAMSSERNYAIVDRDPDDVADLRAIYESDWAAGPPLDLACTRLIVSPVNSQQRILDHVTSAKSTLDIEVLYLTEPGLVDAVVAAAARGVAVRVLLSDPAKNPQNTATQAMFTAKGIPAKILLANYLHAKMIQADGIALVGSENMSLTSFTMNREVGALVFEPTPAGQIHDQYELDWAAAQ